jgi:hypothetical protein
MTFGDDSSESKSLNGGFVEIFDGKSGSWRETSSQSSAG